MISKCSRIIHGDWLQQQIWQDYFQDKQLKFKRFPVVVNRDILFAEEVELFRSRHKFVASPT